MRGTKKHVLRPSKNRRRSNQILTWWHLASTQWVHLSKNSHTLVSFMITSSVCWGQQNSSSSSRITQWRTKRTINLSRKSSSAMKKKRSLSKLENKRSSLVLASSLQSLSKYQHQIQNRRIRNSVTLACLRIWVKSSERPSGLSWQVHSFKRRLHTRVRWLGRARYLVVQAGPGTLLFN